MPVNGAPGLYRLCARLFAVALGLLAVGWGVVNFLAFWRQASVQRVALHVIEREPFTAETLASQLSNGTLAEQAQSYCNPILLRSVAIIQFRIAEDAMAARDRMAIDGALADAQAAIRRSLACSPADSFSWLGLFWITNVREGFNPRNLKFLRLSYRLGPNEGWIADTRNRIAIAMFGTLPQDIKDMVISEFLAFIKTGEPDVAAGIFIGAGQQVRSVLLARIQDVDVASRAAFMHDLHFKYGVNLDIPEAK